MKGKATRGNYVAFGEFGLQSLGTHWVSARQIEAGRITAQHFPSPSRQGCHSDFSRQTDFKEAT